MDHTEVLMKARDALLALNMPMGAWQCEARNSALAAISKALATPSPAPAPEPALVVLAADLQRLQAKPEGDKAIRAWLPPVNGDMEVPLYLAPPVAPSPAVTHRLKAEDVQWIVNDIAELGVMIHGQAFFLYKGHSLVYEDATHDETGEPMRYRPVFKREFGECAHPINYADPTRIGTVSLNDSGEWRELPPAHPPVQPTGSAQP